MLDTLHEPEANDLPASLFEETAPSRLRLGGQDKPPKPVLGQCFHQITSGHYCNAPALRGEYFCRHHFKRGSVIAPPNTRYELPEITGRESLRTAVLEIAGRVGANSLDIRRAGIMLYSLQIALSTFPPLPRPRAGQKEEQIDTSPEAGLTEAERYRAIIDRFERENGPPPPVVYPADLLPKTGKVEVGHSCFAPPGWKPGDPHPEFDAILLKTRPSTPPAAAAIADEERDEMEKEYLLPDLTPAPPQQPYRQARRRTVMLSRPPCSLAASIKARAADSREAVSSRSAAERMRAIAGSVSSRVRPSEASR